jgi:hypothetical protein
MTVIFQIEALSELEEISGWLAQRKIVIQRVETGKIGTDAFIKRLKRYKINLPADYKFNRDEANER